MSIDMTRRTGGADETLETILVKEEEGHQA